MLTDGQKAVLRAFYEFGAMTDVALAVYVHHVEEASMASSGIRTRRAELSRATEDRPAFLGAIGTKKLKSGRLAAIHALTPPGHNHAVRLFGTTATSNSGVVVRTLREVL